MTDLEENRDPESATASEEVRHGRGGRILLGAGGAVENSFANAPMVLANPIFNIGFGINPIVIGIALSIPRFWEILFDPFIGVVSDKTKSRFGPRLPYLVPGAIISGLLFATIWWVPHDWSDSAKSVWLVATVVLFYTANSLYMVPYAALTLDETRAGPERVGVMTARTAFANASTILIAWLYWLCQRDIFGSPLTGIRWVGLAFGIALGLIGLLAVIPAMNTLRLRPAAVVADPARAAVRKEKNWGIYRSLLQVRGVRRILATLLCIMLSFTMVGHLGFYVLAYHACQGDLKQAALVAAIKGTVGSIMAVLACPLIAKVTNRIGKYRTLQILLLVGGVGNLGNWWLITPVNPYLTIIPYIGIVWGLAGFWSLMPVFLGDVNDEYKRVKGESCEGSLSALYGVAIKIGVSVALLTTGYILVLCAFDAELPLEQLSTAIFRMRLAYALVPTIGVACALYAMRYFKNPVGSGVDGDTAE